ncbi:MAG: DEAD/DEAH box helicase, partial [Clostridia bacterium]
FGAQALLEAFRQVKDSTDFSSVYPTFPRWTDSEDVGLSYMLCARMLFSALVDADYSASAEHFEPDYLATHTSENLDAAYAMTRLEALRKKKQKNAKGDTNLNRIRDKLFDDCLAAAQEPPGLFTLTAPTGTGKTLSLFAFAAAHAQKWGKRRIILLLPFLALAEQNVKDYRMIIPELLESHSAAVLSEKTRLLAERWSAACIVTTTVGFFEPLFSSRPTDCRRLHQIANSVIVMDEAQSLPAQLLDATLRCVKQLCDSYGCTVVFSTATQPSYQYRPGVNWKPREIVPKPQELFFATRRVEYEWRVDTATSLESIADELAEVPQSCAILNLRRHAAMLYRLVQERCIGEEVFFLSSDLCLAHRRTILAEIVARLDAGLPCRLVSTQCIEAGIDLDFPVLYRALAPLDSIIQAAGRCNRNGAPTPGHLVVFVPDVAGKLYPGDYYETAANCVKTILAREQIDCSNLAHIDMYYEELYKYSAGDNEKLKEAIEERDFHTVAETYRLIDKGCVNVVVPYGPELSIYEKIRDEVDVHGLSHGVMKQARAITVSSFWGKKVREICVPIKYRVPGGGWSDETGWYLLGVAEKYNEKTGLQLDEDYFCGIL